VVAKVGQLHEQRDLWKRRARKLKELCKAMQLDLAAMTQIAQTALPCGGGFQADDSIWSDRPVAASVASFMVSTLTALHPLPCASEGATIVMILLLCNPAQCHK
jgi:hypothetical protein